MSIGDFQKASQGLYFLLLIALLYSFFLITISNILLLLLGLIYLSQHYRSHQWQWLPTVLLMLGFMPYLQGLLLSESTSGALKEIQHNLAYLSIPIAVLLLPTLTYKQRNEVFAFFILLMAISVIPVLYKYITNFDEITLSLGKGKAVPTPIDHVRYSIFLALACVFSFISFLQDDAFFSKKGRKFYGFVALFLFISLHVLAVRSGILLSYVGLFIAGFLILWKRKKYSLIVTLLVLMIASPLIAYYTIPSFHKKIHYSLWDYGQQQSGDGAHYSDSERIRSYKIGLEIWNDFPILGKGTGDIQEETRQRYTAAYPEGGRSLLPHNQFIKFLAMSGIVGLVFFLISFYIPLFMYANVFRPHVIALIAMLSVSFLVEATLERSYMLNLYLILAALLYKRGNDQVP